MTKSPKTGVIQALLCLVLLGFMPIISNARSFVYDALIFALFLSLWQSLFALPLVIREVLIRAPSGGKLLDSAITHRKPLSILLVTGIIFGLSTYLYVLSVEKAGAINAAIAMQAYPLFAILWEVLFLNKRKTLAEMTFTLIILTSLYFLATKGTAHIEGMSLWFLVALCVPLLWSVAHVIIKQTMEASPVSPALITLIRAIVSSLLLIAILLISNDGNNNYFTILDRAFLDINLQFFAMLMGLVYYVELITWFNSIRHIDVSLASTITVPWPALTMIITFFLLGEQVEHYQIISFVIIALSIYALIYLDNRKARMMVGRQL